jgi:hypothetical protein
LKTATVETCPRRELFAVYELVILLRRRTLARRYDETRPRTGRITFTVS